MKPLSLYELNNLVRQTLELSLDDTYWIQAELSEVNQRHGHCFLEFVQKGTRSGDSLIAKARGQIWANRWAAISSYFMRTTGQSLQAGMNVLVEVSITFHELYGYSLNIVDIDPTYTMGDIARRRQEILRQLKEEGVDTMNKELPLPSLMRRIAVISSPTAAGYGDFHDQLINNPYSLAFDIQLFPATMQGDSVESSIISALTQIAHEEDQWDVVVIIRGGGAAADLSGFDTLSLAENVAQFPLPIITGIGHERDDTVIDMVSHTRVKTPTAAAEFIIQHGAAQLSLIDDLQSRIQSAVQQILSAEQMKLQMLSQHLPSFVASYCREQNNHLERLSLTIGASVRSRIAQENGLLQLTEQKLHSSSAAMLMLHHNTLQNIKTQIDAADPKRILRLGFSITRSGGKVVRNASDLPSGTTIETTLAEGSITSVVS